jgi:urocanate hydratase
MFTAFCLARQGWHGTFVLGVGLGDRGQALALALLAVGACGLFLEGDAGRMRAAERAGCCTFTVNSLSEALLPLKNELRQGRAITVGLSGDPTIWLQEMAERGVLPDVVASESDSDGVLPLVGWGARAIHGLGLSRVASESLDLGALLEVATARTWRLENDIAETMVERRERDAALLGGIGSEAPLRDAMRQWLQVSPSLFPREKIRAHWVEAG